MSLYGRFKGSDMERDTYLRPEAELVVVKTERGFAVSGEVEGFDREDWNE